MDSFCASVSPPDKPNDASNSNVVRGWFLLLQCMAYTFGGAFVSGRPNGANVEPNVTAPPFTPYDVG